MFNSCDDIIRGHYDGQAKELGLEPTSTMLDLTVRRRETELISRFCGLVIDSILRQGNANAEIAVCDVGCGNGYTLLALSEQYLDVKFQGFEFTPSLRELAESRFRCVNNVMVSHGDVRAIDCADGMFDIVLCQRVLINLLNPVDQLAGLAELARITRPGGHLLSIEAFQGPLACLNEARAEFDLPPLGAASHNQYLPSDFYSAEPCLVPLTGPMLDLGLPLDFLPSNFLSSHYFVSRLLHPLALGPTKQFTRNSHFVLFLTEAFNQPIGDYAPIKAYAFRRVVQ